MNKINLQQTHLSTEPKAGSSRPRRIFTSRISDIFYKKNNFEKNFSQRLDKIILLSTKVSKLENTHNLIRKLWDSLNNNSELQAKSKNFIKRFQIIENKEQIGLNTLLSLIKNHEHLSKALQMIDNKIEFSMESSEKLGIIRIKTLIHKTFNLQKENESSKVVNANQFIRKLSTIPEEEENKIGVIMYSTKL